MRILLISPNREEINMLTWPVGLACVAAATQKAGHELRLVDLIEAKDPTAALEEAVREFNPDVIGIAVRNIDNQSMEEPQFLLEEVREVVAACRGLSNAPIVLGGAGIQHLPGEFIGIPGRGHGHSRRGRKSLP